VIRLSAAIISAAGSSRPARAPLPEVSCQASTRASARPSSARRRAASVDGENHPAQRCSQLPGRHQPGFLAERRGDRGGDIIEHRKFGGEDVGTGAVDEPGEQRGQHRRNPGQLAG